MCTVCSNAFHRHMRYAKKKFTPNISIAPAKLWTHAETYGATDAAALIYTHEFSSQHNIFPSMFLFKYFTCSLFPSDILLLYCQWTVCDRYEMKFGFLFPIFSCTARIHMKFRPLDFEFLQKPSGQALQLSSIYSFSLFVRLLIFIFPLFLLQKIRISILSIRNQIHKVEHKQGS